MIPFHQGLGPSFFFEPLLNVGEPCSFLNLRPTPGEQIKVAAKAGTNNEKEKYGARRMAQQSGVDFDEVEIHDVLLSFWQARGMRTVLAMRVALYNSEELPRWQ